MTKAGKPDSSQFVFGKGEKSPTEKKAGKGGGKASGAQAPVRGAQASDLSRFAADAETIQPLGRVLESWARVTVGRPDGTARTFEGPDVAEAQARAAAWLREAPEPILGCIGSLGTNPI